MLERSLGTGTVLNFDLAPDLPLVSVDRNQAENAILNLAINARDAMPDGGVLTIATHGTPCGDQVVLDLGDTGVGMAPEVVERAFEPFFTTKLVGQGTGLGLSQVYGFIKQSMGDVSIRSIAEKGTTVTLTLPVAPAGETVGA